MRTLIEKNGSFCPQLVCDSEAFLLNPTRSKVDQELISPRYHYIVELLDHENVTAHCSLRIICYLSIQYLIFGRFSQCVDILPRQDFDR